MSSLSRDLKLVTSPSVANRVYLKWINSCFPTKDPLTYYTNNSSSVTKELFALMSATIYFHAQPTLTLTCLTTAYIRYEGTVLSRVVNLPFVCWLMAPMMRRGRALNNAHLPSWMSVEIIMNAADRRPNKHPWLGAFPFIHSNAYWQPPSRYVTRGAGVNLSAFTESSAANAPHPLNDGTTDTQYCRQCTSSSPPSPATFALVAVGLCSAEQSSQRKE